MFVNVTTKSAQHAHARMIAIIVEKSPNSGTTMVSWIIPIFRQSTSDTSLTSWRQQFCNNNYIYIYIYVQLMGMAWRQISHCDVIFVSVKSPRYWLAAEYTLQWRHSDRDGVFNHRRLDCLLYRVIRRRSKKTWKLRVTGLWWIPRASNAENVSILWRHHKVKGLHRLYLPVIYTYIHYIYMYVYIYIYICTVGITVHS